MTRVPIFLAGDTVAKARHVIEQKHDWESVNYCYLANREKLTGVFSIKTLLTSPLDVELRTLLHRELVTVGPNTSPERVAILAIHHGIDSVPVVDRRGKMLGVVGREDIMQTLQRAGIDDAIRYSGIHLESRGLLDVLHGRILFLTKRRLPWLIIGSVGGLIASFLVGLFEPLLRSMVELAFFTPAVIYIGDAVGTQTQALFLRAITIGEVRVGKFMAKEAVVNALLGLIIGALSWLAIMAFLRNFVIATIVGVAMFLTIISSGLVAIFLTTIFSNHKEDPALGAGPFATIIQDIVSVIVYFLVATVVLWLN